MLVVWLVVSLEFWIHCLVGSNEVFCHCNSQWGQGIHLVIQICGCSWEDNQLRGHGKLLSGKLWWPGMWTSRRKKYECPLFRPQNRRVQTCPFLYWRKCTACLHLEIWIQADQPSSVSRFLPPIVYKWKSIYPKFWALFSTQSSGKSVASKLLSIPHHDGHSHGALFNQQSGDSAPAMENEEMFRTVC